MSSFIWFCRRGEQNHKVEHFSVVYIYLHIVNTFYKSSSFQKSWQFDIDLPMKLN